MTSASWITMIAIMGFVWGGLLVLLVTALRKESGRGGDGGLGRSERRDGHR
jgi:hypothetical protein